MCGASPDRGVMRINSRTLIIVIDPRTFLFLTLVDERAPAAAVAEERGKSARALRWIDPETRSTDLDVLV